MTRPVLSPPVVHRTGEGPPLVLLHPLGVDRLVWEPLVQRLDGWCALTYDLPGHGDSPVPASPYTIADLADQLADLLREAAVGPACVVGVSLGGLVAQVLAARYPELVDRLVVVDAVATYPDVLRQQWHDRQHLVRTQGMEPLLQATLDLWFTADTLRAVREDGDAVDTVRRLFLGTDPEGYALACEALRLADTTGLVHQITAPTLILCGRDDAAPFTAAAPWFVETLPTARLVWLEPARHAGFLEQGRQFHDALVDFLRAGRDGAGAGS